MKKTDLILERIKEYLQPLKENWILIAIVAGVLGVFSGISASMEPVLQTATTSFNPEVGRETGAPNPLSIVLGGETENPNGEVAGVLTSRTLSEIVVRDTVTYKGKRHLLADIVIDKIPVPFTAKVMRIFSSRPDSIPKKQKVIRAGRYIRNEERLVVKTNDEGFMVMKFTFVEKQLVQVISNAYLEKLTKYYKEQKTEKAQNSVKFFTARSDSVRKELERTNRELAKYLDESISNILLNQYQVKQKELEAEASFLNRIYATLIQSKEAAVGQLEKDTPIIQVLDPPDPPYRKHVTPVLKNIIGGFILGAILAALFIARRLIWEDAVTFIKKNIDGE